MGRNISAFPSGAIENKNGRIEENWWKPGSYSRTPTDFVPYFLIHSSTSSPPFNIRHIRDKRKCIIGRSKIPARDNSWHSRYESGKLGNAFVSRLLGFKEGFGTRCLLCEEREKHVGLSAVNHITSLFYFHGYTLWRETGRGQWSYRESSLGGLFRPAFVSRYCLTLSDTTLDRIIPASCSRDTHQI